MTRRAIRFSAFVEDMRLDALPEAVRTDIKRFIDAKDHHQVPHYGMVVKELIPKADPVNMKTARAHVRKDANTKMMGKIVMQATRRGDKYILLLNDRIIDGHHFLAKAERAGITSSLNVLDLTPARFQFSGTPPVVTAFRTRFDELLQKPTPPQKPKRSGFRTAAIVAGGGGLGYGGYEVGRAARAARQTIAAVRPNVEAATANAAAVTGAVRKVGAPFMKVRKAFGFSTPGSIRSLRKDRGGVLAFGFGQSVAQDRYRKAIKEHESNRAESNYTRSALVGGALGALLRKPGFTRGQGALIGGAAGLATQAAVRSATAPSKDQFGDRPLGAKRLEKAPWQAGAVAAGAIGYRKVVNRARAVRSTLLHAKGTRSVIRFDAGSTLGNLIRNRRVLSGAALAGGIATADAVTSATHPVPDQTRTGAAAEGAGRGLLYGSVLAGAEPLLHSGFRRLVKARAAAPLRSIAASAQLRRVISFGGSQQLRGEKNRFVNPLDVASGTATAYAGDSPVDLPVRHAQVVRAALNKGRGIQRWGSRVGSLARDASDTVRGVPKVDARGRPQKREWEKSWFKNAAGTAATGAALLGHATLMRRNPAYRTKVAGLVRRGKSAANSVVPDLFPLRAKLRRVVQFGETAPDWDVRDQRGRSARVFAPGAQSRNRRPKEWYEKSDNQRKLLGGLAVAAGIGGAIIGHKLGVATGVKTARTGIAKKGWETRRAAASENANIERMKRRPPGGQTVS